MVIFFCCFRWEKKYDFGVKGCGDEEKRVEMGVVVEEKVGERGVGGDGG